jgi:hypothetical protein
MATKLAVLKNYSYTTAGQNAVSTLASSIIGSSGLEDSTGQAIVSGNINDTNRNLELTRIGDGVIDVVHDFEWNGNNILKAYPKFPKVYMWERTQLESSLVSSYYYYITNIANAFNNIEGTSVTGNTTRITDKLKEFINKSAKTVSDVTGLGTDTTSDSVDSFINFFKTIYQDLATTGSSDQVLLGEFLKSYLGIYFTKQTGFVYVLPYFSNNFQGGTTVWSPTPNQPVLQGVVDHLAETYLPLITPGAYIEQPKYFNFQQTEGDSIEIEFPLLNTISNSYKKNYELLWILAFQNKYYRQGFASVRPPKIYTVQIPGVKYFPYAYISNLSIDFAGTRRLLEVETPRGTIEAPIPDAYIVRMRITSLLSDTANAMLTSQFHKRVNVTITS